MSDANFERFAKCAVEVLSVETIGAAFDLIVGKL